MAVGCRRDSGKLGVAIDEALVVGVDRAIGLGSRRRRPFGRPPAVDHDQAFALDVAGAQHEIAMGVQVAERLNVVHPRLSAGRVERAEIAHVATRIRPLLLEHGKHGRIGRGPYSRRWPGLREWLGNGLRIDAGS